MKSVTSSYKPTLLFVEECESTLSKKVISNGTVQVVLLRFKQSMVFSREHLDVTADIPTFIFDKELPVETMVEQFCAFCACNKIVVDYFYNDSEYNQEIVQRFASLLELPGALDEYQSSCVRDKLRMKNLLQELGYRTAHYRELTSVEDVFEFARNHGGFPLIVKWRKGLSSKEVYRVESKEHLLALGLDYSSRRFIAETYCADLIWCFDSLVQDGNVVGTFLTWLPYTNLAFAEKKQRFMQITAAERPTEIKFDGGRITQNLVNELRLKNGYMQIEIFVDLCGRPTICEFAWRTAGEHMLSNQSLAFGVDVCSLLVDIVVGRKVQQIPSRGLKCVGDMFLPLYDGVVVDISSFQDLCHFEGVIGGEVKYRVGDIVRSRRQYTSCSGWVQVEGQTIEQVQRRMLKVYENFRIVTK